MSISQDELQERAVNVVDYLRALSLARTEKDRDGSNYEHILWIHDLPREKECVTRAWGPVDDLAPDIWLRVKKRREPSRPAVPRECRQWVDEDSLKDTSDIPTIRSTIVEEVTTNTAPDGTATTEFITRRLEDYPDVIVAWDKYLDDQWVPWQEQHDRWERIHAVYSKLFQIYQAQQRKGEELELVFGLGLLQWRTPAGLPIRRHVFTTRSVLSFDAPRGEFCVEPSPDAAEITLELDMLDPDPQFVLAEDAVRQQMRDIDPDIWDRAAVDPLIKALAEHLADRSEYFPNLFHPIEEKTPAEPIITFSPSLVLRKRSARGLVRLLEAIRSQIDRGVELPDHFRELCEDFSPSDIEESDSELNEPVTNETSVFFPLLVNDEQKQILHKLRATTGVLVQGPPGTGKSHTIANLICHLLASGQRVLVTAQTQKALQVLQGLLPESIRPLCVSLLGTGLEEQRGLESSVSQILSRLDQWNLESYEEIMSQLEATLDELRRKQAEASHRLRQLRENDTTPHAVADGAYSGTAASIARQLEAETARFGWLDDELSDTVAMPLRPTELVELLSELRSANYEGEGELLATYLKDEHLLPDLQQFNLLVAVAAERRLQLEGFSDVLETPTGAALLRVSHASLRHLRTRLNDLSLAVERLRANGLSWVNDAVQEIVAGMPRLWQELHQETTSLLGGLAERARTVAPYAVRIPKGHDHAMLLCEAKVLECLFREVKKLHFWSLWSQPFRQYRHLIRDVKVNGRTCDHVEPLGDLIAYLSVEETLARAWGFWKGKVDPLDADFSLQVAKLSEHLAILLDTLQLQELLNDARASLSQIPGLAAPAWHDSQAVRNLVEACKVAMRRKELDEAERRLDAMIRQLRPEETERAHPSTAALITAMANRDCEGVSETVDRIRILRNVRETAVRRNRHLEQLGEIAPRLRDRLEQTFTDEAWDTRLAEVERAWNWARAKHWLQEWNQSNDADYLEPDIKRREETIRATIGDLASVRAWKYFFDRMAPHNRRHLLGWQQAVTKLGKGTGRHAWKHRRDAQEHLNQCREAVPAWVMPLYRVFETLIPVPGAFDVIVVDEASQCGPNSLVLFYLAKRVIVVGDDQQISPEAVGLDRDVVDGLRAKYLRGFEHSDSFGADSSLFDHAKRRFGNRIVLREHFRCMPEIIWFSNDLCYSATPLIPLRQYPPDRLEPLVLRFVTHGYREGDGSRVINRPEATELVNAIVECCHDSRYIGRTMGVITLQGNAQARIIEELLLNSLGAEEMAKRRLICGDPYSFQGDERHVIFLSMVAAPNETIGALTRAPDQRRFNVAASRAKDQMWLFHSAGRDDLNENCLRRKLLEYFENPSRAGTIGKGVDVDELSRVARVPNRRRGTQPAPFGSWFEVDVALAIAANGFHIIPQQAIANKRVDLVVEGKKSRLGIECYGDEWHGADVYDRDMDRQRKIERAGLRIWTLRESAYYANRESALKPLWMLLWELGIKGAESAQPSVKAHHTATDESSETRAPASFEEADESEFSNEDLNAPDGSLAIAAVDAAAASEGRFPHPAVAHVSEVKNAIVAIVRSHGPLPRISAFRIYVINAGLRRVTKPVRRVLNRAIGAALRDGLLEESDDYGSRDQEKRIVRIAGSPAVVLRPRGNRNLDDIPPSEIAFTMKLMIDESANEMPEERDHLYRDVLTHFDLARLTANARQILDVAYGICCCMRNA